jgi:hypothetical protein
MQSPKTVCVDASWSHLLADVPSMNSIDAFDRALGRGGQVAPVAEGAHEAPFSTYSRQLTPLSSPRGCQLGKVVAATRQALDISEFVDQPE